MEKPYLFPQNKISKTVGLIAKLRHIVPTRTLLDTYRSPIAPCIMYGYTWQCMAMHQRPSLINFLFFRKSALRLIYFAQAREHGISFFLKGKLLPLEFLYFDDVNSSTVPVINVSNFFSKSPPPSLVVHVR